MFSWNDPSHVALLVLAGVPVVAALLDIVYHLLTDPSFRTEC